MTEGAAELSVLGGKLEICELDDCTELIIPELDAAIELRRDFEMAAEYVVDGSAVVSEKFSVRLLAVAVEYSDGMELSMLNRELTDSELEAGAELVTVVMDSKADVATKLEAAAE